MSLTRRAPSQSTRTTVPTTGKIRPVTPTRRRIGVDRLDSRATKALGGAGIWQDGQRSCQVQASQRLLLNTPGSRRRSQQRPRESWCPSWASVQRAALCVAKRALALHFRSTDASFHQALESPCSQAFLQAVVPLSIIACAALAQVPWPKRLRRLLAPFAIVGYDQGSLRLLPQLHGIPAPPARAIKRGPAVWRQTCLILLAGTMAVIWMVNLGLEIVQIKERSSHTVQSTWPIWTSAGVAAAWVGCGLEVEQDSWLKPSTSDLPRDISSFAAFCSSGMGNVCALRLANGHVPRPPGLNLL